MFLEFESKILSEIKNTIREEISSIIFDGKIHRFGKNLHAWYIASSWDFKNKNFYQVVFGSWKQESKHQLQSWKDSDTDMEFINRQKEYNKTMQRKLKAETIEKHKRCIEKWKPIWDAAQKGILHDYLKFKKVKYHFGSRITSENILLIPAYNINGFVGVQQIYFQDEHGEYKKKFSYGINKRGAVCGLRDFRYSDKCFVSEGFATAASIQESIFDIPSVCAFDAGNIIPAITTIRTINPNIKIMIAADYDTESGTGQTYAKKAVKQFKDVSYRLPIFKDNKGGTLTDFNDLKTSEGKQRVIDILKF